MKKLLALLALLPLPLFAVNPSTQETTNIASFVVGANTVLLNPPHVGPARTTGRYTAALASSGVLYSPPNTIGIIRDIFVQADLAAGGLLNSNCANVNLQIYADCGSDTNSPAAASFQFNVPLADLMGNRYYTNSFKTNAGYNINRNSALIDSVDIPASALLAGEYEKTLHLKCPIPFTNGCFVRLFNTASNSAYGNGYLGGTIENGTLAYLGIYSNWRLRSAKFLGSGAGGASNFLFTVRGPGVLVGTTQAVADTSGTSAAAFYVDSRGMVGALGASSIWESTGGDDYFLSTYFFAAGAQIGYDFGLTHVWRGAANDSTDMNWDAYRWFVRDGPSWTSSTANVYCDSTSTPQAVSDVWIYYAP